MRPNHPSIKILLLLLFHFTFGQKSLAQKLLQVVSVDIKEQRMEDALATIGKKGDFFFSYSSNFIPKDSIVSVYANNNTVKEVLDLLLNEKYEYKEAHNYIILRPAPFRLMLIPEDVSDKDGYTVAGYVIDERTGAKITQASVYEKRLLYSTLTNQQGYFKIKFKKEDEIVLTVSKELYRDISMVFLPSTSVHPTNTKEGYNPEGYLRRVESTALGKLFISSRQKIQSLNLSGFFTNSPFQASLTPGLSSHGIFNSQVINKFSLNLGGGYNTGVKGVEIAGGFNINKQDVSYLQIAGIFNVVGGSVVGVQVAGINNTIFNNVKGIQIGGIYNDVRGDFSGIQIAGLVNKDKKNAGPIQIAGIINQVEGNSRGVQIAGICNDIRGDFSGIQIAGLINKNKKNGGPLQLAGLINHVEGNAESVQIAGLGNINKGASDGVQVGSIYNYTRKLKGLQLGLINIADSSSGVSVGLINIIKDGYHKIALSYNEVLNTNVSLKLGNAKLYTIFTGGINISDKKAYSVGIGLGHDFILNKRWSLSAEIVTSIMYAGDWRHLVNLHRAKTVINFQIVKGLYLFAGPAINLFMDENFLPISGYKSIKPTENTSFNYSKNAKGWIGLEAGIIFF